MKTEIIRIENHLETENINRAASLLKKGCLVAFPTETVYGIGANALDLSAIAKIYTAKGRPSDNPLIIHIGYEEEVQLYAKRIPAYANKLIEAFWPGPLTLIFEKQPIIPDEITGGLNTVAIRMPKNPIALALIRAAQLPIAAPSANTSGKPSPTRGRHVIEDLDGKVEMIIDGGSAEIGLESTVLDVTHEIPVILRPGSITEAMIRAVVGVVAVDPHLKEASEIPKSPGMKYKHYAPKGQLLIYRGDTEAVINHINLEVKKRILAGHKVGIIATLEHLDCYHCDHIVNIGSETNQNEIASNLFKVLRIMDDLEVEYIYTRSLNEADIGKATMNRLLKAAGNHLIEV